jgi:plasmid stabilization system protein ParE
MKRPVRILVRAQSDLAQIQRYVERDRPGAAIRLVERLLDTIAALESHPRSGIVPRDERLAGLEFRVCVQGEYLVFYKVLPSVVRVYRVLHGRRKYAALIRAARRDKP